MNIPNHGFICELCGQSDLIASIIILKANYGSVNDGEHLELNVCGECIDKIYGAIQCIQGDLTAF